jgi:hypothetical protein
MCGDINIDYLTDTERTKQLEAVLLSYNLMATVHFPTRAQKQSNTAIDNIFIDNYKFTKYNVSPIYHQILSDHDAQLLTIKDKILQTVNHRSYSIRNINKYSMEEFKIRLSYESWDADKRRSLGRYNSLADSDPWSFFFFFYESWDSIYIVIMTLWV